MSYQTAKACFADMQRYAPMPTHPAEYDLAAGLLNLCDAIQQDTAETQRLLRVLVQAVEDLQRRR
jgi:hypothetical protein